MGCYYVIVFVLAIAYSVESVPPATGNGRLDNDEYDVLQCEGDGYDKKSAKEKTDLLAQLDHEVREKIGKFMDVYYSLDMPSLCKNQAAASLNALNATAAIYESHLEEVERYARGYEVNPDLLPLRLAELFIKELETSTNAAAACKKYDDALKVEKRQHYVGPLVTEITTSAGKKFEQFKAHVEKAAGLQNVFEGLLQNFRKEWDFIKTTLKYQNIDLTSLAEGKLNNRLGKIYLGVLILLKDGYSNTIDRLITLSKDRITSCNNPNYGYHKMIKDISPEKCGEVFAETLETASADLEKTIEERTKSMLPVLQTIARTETAVLKAIRETREAAT